MTETTIAFIGLGLIGGSIAKAIKRHHPEIHIKAYMRTRSKLEQAQADGIVDTILTGIDENLSDCDMIFLCTPVEFNASYLTSLKKYLKADALLTDVGSTKTNIHEEIIHQDMAANFIGGHPMAGSEKTGYEHATEYLLENAYYIITPTDCSTDHQIDRMIRVAKTIGSLPLVLPYKEHDQIVAAVSHLPHIIASSLVNLVKDSDNKEEIMKQVAAGGFKDITRIASASPQMWQQICSANALPISNVLERYINNLTEILGQIKQGNQESIHELFETSKTYRNSLEDQTKGSITPDYSFSVDIVDEVGSISTLSVILASKGISIKNIGINHNREHGEGALRITFYDEKSMTDAWKKLEQYHYQLIKS